MKKERLYIEVKSRKMSKRTGSSQKMKINTKSQKIKTV